MDTTRDTEQAINELLAVASGMSLREAYLYRQSLLALVRLAKAEQMREVRDSVTRLIGEGGRGVLAAGLDMQGSQTAFNPLN